jgi:hypothetical protein
MEPMEPERVAALIKLQLAVDMVGNSVVAVRKQMGIDCKAEPLR